MKRARFWTPRILGILFAVFISLFALDVFGEGYAFWETMVALLMHLIPTDLIVIVLVVAWRWERIGGVLFLALGALFFAWFGRPFEWGTLLLLTGMPLLLGVLFLADAARRGGERNAPS